MTFRTKKKPKSLFCIAALIALIAAQPDAVLAQSSPEERMENARRYYRDCLASGLCQPGDNTNSPVADPAGMILEEVFSSYLNSIFSVPGIVGQPEVVVDTRSVWDMPDPVYVEGLQPGWKYWTMGQGTDAIQLLQRVEAWYAAAAIDGEGYVVRRSGGRYAFVLGAIPPDIQVDVEKTVLKFEPSPPSELKWMDGTDFLGVIWLTDMSLEITKQGWKEHGATIRRFESNGRALRLHVSPYESSEVLVALPAGRHVVDEGHCSSGSPQVVWCQVVIKSQSMGHYIGWTPASAYK